MPVQRKDSRFARALIEAAKQSRSRLQPVELPDPFAHWLDRVLGSKSSANGNPSSRRQLQQSLAVYALVCRSILLGCTAHDECGNVEWEFPRHRLSLDWLDRLSATEEGKAVTRFVDEWLVRSEYRLTGDVLRVVYEALVPRTIRRNFGEHYTPEWLCDHVVEQLWTEGTRWLDPAAGAGAFLLALHRKSRVAWGAIRFVGIDCNPWAVLAAAANAAWAHADRHGSPDADFKIPIAWADAVVDADLPDDLLHGGAGFDRILGNPPWIVWDRLPNEYRVRSAGAWTRYGFFTETGMSSILGGGKKDLSMLLTYIAADRYLRPGGRLGFVVTRSVFTAAGSGRGFRRWTLPDGVPLRVDRVDDLSERNPFSDVSAKTAVVFLTKGKPTQYPVPYVAWRQEGRDVASASPSEPADPLSSWSHYSAAQSVMLERVLGTCDYHAHLGVNTGGANGVYWMKRLAAVDETLWELENLPERGRVPLPCVRAVLETRYLFPVLLGKDVRAWYARPSAWMLMVQDSAKRRGVDVETLENQAPRTLAYLCQFEDALRRRAAFQRYFTRQANGEVEPTAPFYSMFDVGAYTDAPVKVVWNRMGHRLAAAVVTDWERKLVLPQETHCLIGVSCEPEAHYLAALLNSPWAQKTLELTAQVGGKSFATPRSIHRLHLKRFDAADPLHQRLAAAAEAAQTQVVLEGVLQPALLRLLENLTSRYWGLSSRTGDCRYNEEEGASDGASFAQLE